VSAAPGVLLRVTPHVPRCGGRGLGTRRAVRCARGSSMFHRSLACRLLGRGDESHVRPGLLLLTPVGLDGASDGQLL
jgi:hypothetical protein